MTDSDVTRRAFLRTAAGTTAAGAAATGTAAGQSEEPDFGGWLDGVDGGFQDHRGEDEVTVQVGASGNGGNLAFSPAGVWVDQGATVVWEWTGDGGAHNVVAEEGPHDVNSGSPEEGSDITYEYTFEEGGITKYVCEPHASLNMQGAVAVGDDVPTVSTGGGGGGGGVPSVPDTAKSVAVGSFIAMTATLGLAFFFIKYGGDYETPE